MESSVPDAAPALRVHQSVRMVGRVKVSSTPCTYLGSVRVVAMHGEQGEGKTIITDVGALVAGGHRDKRVLDCGRWREGVRRHGVQVQGSKRRKSTFLSVDKS